MQFRLVQIFGSYAYWPPKVSQKRSALEKDASKEEGDGRRKVRRSGREKKKAFGFGMRYQYVKFISLAGVASNAKAFDTSGLRDLTAHEHR